jgi:hypothetical protein
MNTQQLSGFERTSNRRLLGVLAACGVIGVALGMAAAVSASHANEAAQRTADALRVVRTNNWLTARNLDVNSSVDMMKALIIACDELRARGDRC